MGILCKPGKDPLYWYARTKDGKIISGKTEPGQKTVSGATEFEYGDVTTVATKLDKYKADLQVEDTSKTATTDKPTGFVRDKDGKVKWVDYSEAEAVKAS